MFGTMRDALRMEIEGLREASLYKSERVIVSPQGPEIAVAAPSASEPLEVVNFCANNYLGLADDPRVVAAAHEALDRWGFGTSSVRFICGTFGVHKELERRFSQFLGTEDTILYSSCFDANGGYFEPFFGAEDAILADALNHASVIDGVRLTKARRLIYAHSDMADLEAKLAEAADARYRVIATDGVFSMDGDIADLAAICDLAERYHALVMVDDSHATGFVGPTGRGTPELCGVTGRVDVVTTTFGKALGGASGGCASGRAEIIEWLRQKSRPYLFSNTLAPVVAATTVSVLDLLSETTELRDRLERSARSFRVRMTEAGFDIRPGEHPIVPVMLYDEALAHQMADALLSEGIYVIGFSYPVVPKGKARIRVQISAAHTDEQLDRAVDAFIRVGKSMGVLPT
ncbi:MAG: glycine C-acetyltransferase [Coriobacteriia bacterium]|nr:glycine C-acetyltransferase [Coriobacteriia bacterium]MBN2840292.1 glycine C-acetyltransferase [Coriobacteriia bacterium]